jgi:hypothetical protein
MSILEEIATSDIIVTMRPVRSRDYIWFTNLLPIRQILPRQCARVNPNAFFFNGIKEKKTC